MIPDSMWKISGAIAQKKFSDDEMTQTDALDEFLIRVHNETFAVSGMIFQDAWNLDLERLKRCYIWRGGFLIMEWCHFVHII
mgnify:CR=1 FL=1